MASSKSSSSSASLVVFWLPIILAVISLIGTSLQILAPQFAATLATKPSESDVTPSPIPAPVADSDNDCIVDQGKQICWGTAELASNGSHTRGFTFAFHQPFSGNPVIATNIDVKSSGYAFAVYNSTLDEKTYRGAIVEVQFRPNTSAVSMSYIAIGRPGS